MATLFHRQDPGPYCWNCFMISGGCLLQRCYITLFRLWEFVREGMREGRHCADKVSYYLLYGTHIFSSPHCKTGRGKNLHCWQWLTSVLRCKSYVSLWRNATTAHLRKRVTEEIPDVVDAVVDLHVAFTWTLKHGKVTQYFSRGSSENFANVSRYRCAGVSRYRYVSEPGYKVRDCS